MAKQELREAYNNVTIEGILTENKLDYKKTVGEGKDYISGDLLIEISPNNIVPVNFFSFKYKKDGAPNRIYGSLENVIETYKSIAKHGREEADKIRITGGKIEANEFYNASGQLISTFRIRSNFVNRVSGEFEPQASFQVETYIQGITEEVKDDVPTDRVIINGVVPMYKGKISLLKFFVENDAGKEYVQKNYSKGDTVKLAGILDNEIVEINRTQEMEFGGDIVDTYTRIKRELIVNKGGKPYEEEEKFDTALIKQAMTQREVDLNTQKEQTMAKNAPSATSDDVLF
jgi:hypothetical protein